MSQDELLKPSDKYVILQEVSGEIPPDPLWTTSSTITLQQWKYLFYFLTFVKFLTFFDVVAVFGGGVNSWCDCTNRTYATPFQKHLHGFGMWYQIFIWIHVIVAVIIIFPALIAMFTPKGTFLHVNSGRVFLICWIVQMCVGVSTGGFAQIARGPYPGQVKGEGNYWGTFPLYVFILFSFVLSSACEQLANGTAALQFRKSDSPHPVIHQILIFGGFGTMINGFIMLVLATFTLANHPEAGTSGAFYPWLYYIFVPVEMFMAGLNLKYWLSPVEERKWLFHHVRCMAWSVFLTFFFILENITYKIAGAYNWSMWWMLPVWIINFGLFIVFILYYYKSLK